MSRLQSDKDLKDFSLKLECEIIPKLKSAGFERNKYNIFNILQLNRQELKHSEFLAFLMNIDQSGEVGVQFLRHFLILLSKELELEPASVFNYEFEKVIVRREHLHIDLLVDVKIKNKSENILIIIENKIYAGERIGEKDNEGQLPEYRQAIENEYKGKNYKTLFLFLTPDKRQPKKDIDSWLAKGYDLIYEVLYRLNLDSADNTIKTLINDYRKMIRSEFEMEIDEQTQTAVNKIYADYGDVFDFINKYKPNRINTTAKVIREFLSNANGIEFKGDRQNANIVFTTTELKNICNNIFFQIYVNEMTMWVYIDGGTQEQRLVFNMSPTAKYKNLTKSISLFGDKVKVKEHMETYEKLLIENKVDELKADCQELLKKAFAPSGWVFEQSKRICELLKGEVYDL